MLGFTTQIGDNNYQVWGTISSPRLRVNGRFAKFVTAPVQVQRVVEMQTRIMTGHIHTI